VGGGVGGWGRVWGGGGGGGANDSTALRRLTGPGRKITSLAGCTVKFHFFCCKF